MGRNRYSIISIVVLCLWSIISLCYYRNEFIIINHFAQHSTNSTKHFAQHSTNSTKHFAHNSTNSTKHFAHNSTNSTNYFAQNSTNCTNHFVPNSTNCTNHFAKHSTNSTTHFAQHSPNSTNHPLQNSTNYTKHSAQNSTNSTKHFAQHYTNSTKYFAQNSTNSTKHFAQHYFAQNSTNSTNHFAQNFTNYIKHFEQHSTNSTKHFEQHSTNSTKYFAQHSTNSTKHFAQHYKNSTKYFAPNSSNSTNHFGQFSTNATKLSPNERLKREIGNQKCKIPRFDALHPQIMPYVNLAIRNPNQLNRKAKIENGMLKLKLKNAAHASIRYIHRHKDYKYKYSEPINLMKENRGKAGCIQSSNKSCVLQAVMDSRNASKSVSTKYTLRCKNCSCNPSDEESDDAFFFQGEGRIIHKKTGKCLQSLACELERCIEESTAYDDSSTFLVYLSIGSAQSCQSHCKSHEKCKAWTYIKDKKNCSLQTKLGKRINSKKGYQAGPKFCKNETFSQLHLVNKEKCDTIWSIFRYNNTSERIQHLPTLKCVGVKSYSKVVLLDCESPETQLYLPSNLLLNSESWFLSGLVLLHGDLDVSFPLSAEFVRLDYRQRTKEGNVTEYHSHVIEKNLKYNVTERQNDEELNIIMIMFDSQSNKNVERQFRKTFQYLKSYPHTILLNNHVITGDGTTANLGPMLAGKHVFDLPEARPWYNESQFLDRWPLVFKEFQKKGYVTLYGDDDPFLGALHYRLSGFREQPTDKYLLPYFYSNNCGYQMCHQYAYDYLQRYIDTYSSYKHFSFMSLGKIGHDHIDRTRYADRDTFNFLRSLLENKRHRNNTAIFFFGDHGHRSAKLRETIWGKLEERLPFMSITFPPWVFEKYKEKISMLRLNSHVLTSHFDIYYTLLHLLNPETYKAPSIETRKGRRVTFGKSLFINIAKLNRTCEEAGVPLHFCPCTEYKPANTSDQLVKRIFNAAVTFINNMVNSSTLTKNMCFELQLKKIIRARRVAPSEKMQKHEKTFENAKCDRCGLKEDKRFRMKVTQYELVFSVEPSQGIFEATAEYLHDKKTIRVNPDISRVNRYGDQPRCIANRFPHLRKYCYCKDSIQIQR